MKWAKTAGSDAAEVFGEMSHWHSAETRTRTRSSVSFSAKRNKPSSTVLFIQPLEVQAMSLPRHHNWEENDDGAEGLRRSPPGKRPRDRQMEMLEEMRRMLKGQNEKIESMYRENQELREKVSFLTTDITRLGGYLQQSPAPRMLSDQNSSMQLRLQFVNSCSNSKYSTRKIEADDETPLKVAIYDHNNEIMTCEPFSSMRVHIVAIHGDFDDDHKGHWTEEHFRSKIVTGRPGKEHLLSGKLYFRLQGGVGYLNSAKFQDNSSFVPSKRLKLGVMAADERISQRIQEGITESFAVKDVRGYSTKKNLNPSPCDPVYKLNKIAMNGDRHKLLEKNGIKIVGDFLSFYDRSPEDLRKIGKQSLVTLRNALQDQEFTLVAYKRGMGLTNIRHFLKAMAVFTLRGHAQSNQALRCEQTSSVCNGLQSGASLGNLPSKSKLQQSTSNQSVTPRELESFQVANEEVLSIRNEASSVPSMDNNTLGGSSTQQQCFLEHNTTSESDGNALLPGNPSTDDAVRDHLAELEKALLEDESWGDFDFNEAWANPCSAVEHSTGLSSVNGAHNNNINHGGLSAASEAGSVSYGGLSPPVSEVGSRRYMGYSPSPASKPWNCRFRGL
uniref:Calmodulin-binding protein-like n=1 Tax=Oryza nivara TaxID=4536 RepID=A0A0E0FXU0_ORYNI